MTDKRYFCIFRQIYIFVGKLIQTLCLLPFLRGKQMEAKKRLTQQTKSCFGQPQEQNFINQTKLFLLSFYAFSYKECQQNEEFTLHYRTNRQYFIIQISLFIISIFYAPFSSLPHAKSILSPPILSLYRGIRVFQNIQFELFTMENLLNFKYSQVLFINQTQKIVYLLGSVKQAQGQAIAILTPKIYDPTTLSLSNIHTSFINDIYSRFTADILSSVDVQFIYPITEKLKNKYRNKEISIHYETGQQYAVNAASILQRELPHIQWVNNIIEGKSQVERVLHRHQDFIIVPDFKYTDLINVKKLHLMVIFTNPQLHSIRDLKTQHLDLLSGVKKTLGQVIANRFGLTHQNIRAYFHYPPTFYRLHLHVMHLSLESLSCRVERCHDFNLVIQNIQMKSNYYQEVTLNTFNQK